MAEPKWPKSLVIVRHGQSTQNVAIDLLDSTLDEVIRNQKEIRDVDIPLTEAGKWQAQQTGLFLNAHPAFDICFSSPYNRAMQTAEAIVAQFSYHLKIYKDNRLREKEFGMLHGFTTEEIKIRYPEEFLDRQRDGKYWYRLPRGENYPDVEARVHSFLDKLVRDYGGKSVLLVTHQVPYLMFRALFEHLDEAAVLLLGDVPNCGMQEYQSDTTHKPEGIMRLVKYNLTACQKD
jgi:ribonuclease H / adenosylcobalamin/alpha-ribazole phosphatase